MPDAVGRSFGMAMEQTHGADAWSSERAAAVLKGGGAWIYFTQLDGGRTHPRLGAPSGMPNPDLRHEEGGKRSAER